MSSRKNFKSLLSRQIFYVYYSKIGNWILLKFFGKVIILEHFNKNIHILSYSHGILIYSQGILSLSFQDIKAIYSSLPCYKSLDELFPPTTTVFMVGNPYYGAMGEVCHYLLSEGHEFI